MSSGTPSKRFLCQAPRPDAWDDHAEDVLGHLGSSREKKIASIRASLVRAKRRNPFTPKAGPGRKTNTEHAIAFYEYLLEKLDAQRADEETIRNKDESEDDEEEEEEDTEDLSLQSCEITSLAKKSDARNEHLCSVCDEPGEFVTCSECNLHFHKTCVRPTMTTPPEDKAWRCSYCVLSTEPKNSKTRRQAAAAVRMMARLRNRCRRVKETEKRRGNEPKPDAKSILQESAPVAEPQSDENGVAIQNTMENNDTLSKKRIHSKEESSTPTNKETPEKTPTALSADTDDSQGRAKRARKQPTLYDPQLCPASKWESDDVRAKKTVDSESDTSDDDSASTNGNAESRTPTHRDHNQDDVWCNFCGDDPYIKVCCFCACRVCFGKHHQTKLLLCDRCDDEYHTFCLDPPLKAVPKKKWFCPNCAQSEEKRIGRTSSRVETRGKWKSQGSSRAGEHSTSPSRQKAKGTEHRANHQDQPRDPSGRFLSPGAGRGRSKTPKASTPEQPRKRGRPPAANKAVGSQRKALKDGSSRGRKSSSSRDADNFAKSSSHSSDSTLRRKQEIHDEVSGAVSVTMSRSGRTLKRSPFHDELSSGEQHLRVGRPVTEPTTYQGYATLQQDSSGSVSTGGSLSLQPTFSGGMSADGAGTTNTPEAVVVARIDDSGLQSTKSSPQSSSRIGLRDDLAATSSKALDTNRSGQPFASGLSIDASNPTEQTSVVMTVEGKVPRRKPGARECMQISRRFGVDVIPQKYIDILLDYCKRGKVEHLIRMRERLDDHARFLESQLAGLEACLQEKDAETKTSSMDQKPTVGESKSLNNEP
ncbi:E3 ubiquitin-protein ligase UHRF2 [Fistulifera solaris]|uniref:E3 ubiquitin-protein ligase UHRF2 n=1 Tax=Fistulifera solaris TaxID=1519565 RepID=A0A1Z5JPX7_FISSO|nr:E3 ubiquitin-protein ligase UHRF2 [Fistulifera solaris]|eukprot:GAX16085.1 E3 ubiquitin-protein ligase UHRF2 [Fistulifera solaris]